MGTVVAQDIFQSKLYAIFIGMEGVTGIADDMIIAEKDEMKLDRNFLALGKCMENNLTLNSEKIQALKHMEFPSDKETMRSFLGMINYLNRYSALLHILQHLSVHSHIRLQTTSQRRFIRRTSTD